jgi:cytidyltransferase-like protein
MFESIRKKVIHIEDLHKIRAENNNKKIVFATGCYDILQSGHAVFFNQCKAEGDILVIGVGSDKVIEQLKGAGRPVNPEINRLYLVAAMHDVDYAVLNEEIIEEGKIDFRKTLENLKPDVFVINDDDSAVNEKTALCSKIGIEPRFVSRIVPTELQATSTTRIIDKINFSYKAPLRIDFAGGWTDIPFIMNTKTGYVSNLAIKPLIEYKNGNFNFGGYPRGSGLSTSTAAKLLEMIASKAYNAESKSIGQIGEDLFNHENKELNWAIGRQDQYSIVHGGFHCFEFGENYGKIYGPEIPGEVLEKFRGNLLLLHTGASRNAQLAVEQVYKNFDSLPGKEALKKLARYGKEFAEALANEDFIRCAKIMEANFEAQKQLAPATTNKYLDDLYAFARKNGALGGKICGAGGGGAFIFYCEDPAKVKSLIKKEFVDSFEIDFNIEYSNIKKLNTL